MPATTTAALGFYFAIVLAPAITVPVNIVAATAGETEELSLLELPPPGVDPGPEAP